MNIDATHPSWHPIIKQALTNVDPNYLKELDASSDWLPGPTQIFNAFSRPLSETHYILFGESPYPRPQSANGYAFWDANVDRLWSETGLSKAVNRATSLRNFIKMLLVAKGMLSSQDTSQTAIAKLDKSNLVQTSDDFFTNFLDHGFLLLNASLVFRQNKVQRDAKAWLAFMDVFLEILYKKKPDIELILLGKIAEKINKLPSANKMSKFCAEHPYNLSFINNKAVLAFFKPLHLLDKR